MASWAFGRGVAVLAAGAMLLAGCGKKSDEPAAKATTPVSNGVDQLDGGAILTKARAAVKAVPSYRMKGTITQGADKVVMNFEISKGNVAGSMQLGAANGSVQVLKVGGKQYAKPDDAFWKKNAGVKAATVIQTVHGRWVVVPPSNKDFSEMFSVSDVDSLLKPQSNKVTKGKTGAVDGQPAISLTDGAGQGSLWIATTGQPYPLRLDGPTPADGNLSFGDFGATFTDIVAPAATDVVDLSKLHA